MKIVHFIQENAFENVVCEMATILWRPQCVQYLASDLCRRHYSGYIFVRVASLILSTREVNTLRPRQNGRHFADDTFKRIFVNENVNISLKFVRNGLINNIPAFVQIMAWRRPGDKPLSEPMMVSLLTHICVTRPQWVNPADDGKTDPPQTTTKYNKFTMYCNDIFCYSVHRSSILGRPWIS